MAAVMAPHASVPSSILGRSSWGVKPVFRRAVKLLRASEQRCMCRGWKSLWLSARRLPKEESGPHERSLLSNQPSPQSMSPIFARKEFAMQNKYRVDSLLGEVNGQRKVWMFPTDEQFKTYQNNPCLCVGLPADFANQLKEGDVVTLSLHCARLDGVPTDSQN